MPARQEFFAEVPHERGFGRRRVPGEDTGDTVEVEINPDGTRLLSVDAYRARVTVPLLDPIGNPTGTERELPVTGGSPRRVVREANRRLTEMGSPYVVGMEPREVGTTHYPILRRRPAQ